MWDVCVSMFLCVHSTCAGVHTETRGLHLSRSPPILWDRVAHRTWSSLTQLGWLASEPQWSACLFPSSRATDARYCGWLPRWVLGFWTQGLWLVQQALYGLSHLLKLKHQLFQNQTEMRSKPFSVVLHGFINDVRDKIGPNMTQIIFLAECNFMCINARVSQVHLNINIL